VRGLDNALYLKVLTVAGWSGWRAAGGSILTSPAVVYEPNVFVFLVLGTNNALYANFWSPYTLNWSGYYYLSGATNSDPALVAAV
jgi:hypothetical protein